MRIVQFRAENFKRLRVVEITPDGTAVVLQGRNAQGKSSVLDAIWAALAGRAGQKDVSKPIRDGEVEASVSLTLDDMVVTRRWTDKGSTLTVTSADGAAKFSSPQTMLDRLIGSLSFDPLAFAMADDRTQLSTLMGLVDLGFDPGLLAANRAKLFDERTVVNRDVKRLRAQAQGLEDGFDDDTPADEVDVRDVADRLARRRTGQQELERLSDEHARNQREIERLQTANQELLARAERIRGDIAADEGTDLQSMLDQADETNRQVRARHQYLEVTNELDEAVSATTDLTARIESIDKARADGLAAAKFPIDGLSFDEDGVLYNGVPFRQASSAERLKVSTAMAMAMNPDLRVICIRDANLLDPDNFDAIVQLAEAEDFQVWFESIDPRGEACIRIEDGQVAS